MQRRSNPFAAFPLLACSALAAFLSLGCFYRYNAVRIVRKADFSPIVLHEGLRGKMEARGGEDTINGKGESGGNLSRKAPVFRYFALSWSLAPSPRLNDRGVDFAREGKFREAETMFLESLKDDDAFASAYNNLGIVYEIFGRREDSFEMYSKACLLEPGNDVFRDNFLGLSDSTGK